MTSVSFLEIGVGVALLYAAWKCVKLIPLLHGQQQSGDHCTGSLIALIGALLLLLVYRLLGRKPPDSGGGGGGGGGGTPTIPPVPSPSEPAPVPEPFGVVPAGVGGVLVAP